MGLRAYLMAGPYARKDCLASPLILVMELGGLGLSNGEGWKTEWDVGARVQGRGGSSAALVPMTATHRKHKSTLEKIFKGCRTFSRV